jgi:glyoxylase-like metal-dependent hydrolase (beta-lactamase superfamily II)
MIGRYCLCIVSIVAAAMILMATNSEVSAQEPPPYGALLDRVRIASLMVPGRLPESIQVLEFGEAHPAGSLLLEGGDPEPRRITYTVFQVRYADGWIMIDAGMDAGLDPAVTIWEEQYDMVQRAVLGASLIVLTHEHHDHIAGIVRSRSAETVGAKALLTRAQVESMLTKPSHELVRIDAEMAQRYVTVDYEDLLPIAPGVVLIKAAGHTPGSQMIFIRLSTGAEVLVIGDITWTMAGVEQRRQKPEAVSTAIGEDRSAIQQQLDWLHEVMATQGVTVVNSHDGEWLNSLVESGIVGVGLVLPNP